MQRIRILWGCALLLCSWSAPVLGQETEIVASLDRLEGRAHVLLEEDNRRISARNGLLLRDGDTVITQEHSRLTIKFRDGSEVRMFSQSRFVIQTIREERGRERTFSYRLYLKLGSVWSLFMPRRKEIAIHMPNATIGVKGTVLRATHRDGKNRVTLTEGRIEVRNPRGRVTLKPGQRLSAFSNRDLLHEKVRDLSAKMVLKSEKQRLEFAQNQPEEVFVSIQLVHPRTGAEVQRAGKVYLRSNYERITYPAVASLDAHGFARLPLRIHPPSAVDDHLDGNVYVWAELDEEAGDDSAGGKILFTIPVRGGVERIQVRASTGEGRQVP